MVDRKVTEMDSNPSIADFEEEDDGRDGPLDRLCLVVAALSIPGVLPALAIAAAPVVADALGCRCGSCFHVIWNQEREKAGLDQKEDDDTTTSVRVGIEALKLLIRQDKEKH